MNTAPAVGAKDPPLKGGFRQGYGGTSVITLPRVAFELKGTTVAYWHDSDVPARLAHVSYRGHFGKHMLVLSLTEFDPTRTFHNVRLSVAIRSGAHLEGAALMRNML